MQHLRVRGIYIAPWSPLFWKHVQSFHSGGYFGFLMSNSGCKLKWVFQFEIYISNSNRYYSNIWDVANSKLKVSNIRYLLHRELNYSKGGEVFQVAKHSHTVAMVPPICDISCCIEGNCNNNTRDPKSIIMIYDCLGYYTYAMYYFFFVRTEVK